MRILLTGGAGFIGYHAALSLAGRGHGIVAIDNLNAYYDPALKRARLERLVRQGGFRFVHADITDAADLAALGSERFDVVLHLAAQAGVRHALDNPDSYVHSNLVGHHRILEFARHHQSLQHLVYASSSSVYGNDTKAPFSEEASAVRPVSLYGATKRAGELMSHSYAELFGMKQTGLRFFTVYGRWGRPDMAYWLFTDAILRGDPLPLYGDGNFRRDFTHIDDITAALVRIVETPFRGTGNGAPHRIYNLGNSRPENVRDLIALIEDACGRKARIVNAEAPAGDVRETYADISASRRDFGFEPGIPLSEGIPDFVSWYRDYKRT